MEVPPQTVMPGGIEPNFSPGVHVDPNDDSSIQHILALINWWDYWVESQPRAEHVPASIQEAPPVQATPTFLGRRRRGGGNQMRLMMLLDGEVDMGASGSGAGAAYKL
ncbi:hypothetical protein PIB30_070767 [Stylosanthes scabra]|uniref:Uncharacterized protein n=1 Tax=Stylosanthes scabra TaxID=79078 RepID=A0ABU6XMF1_9FABA|nr:hypothetical protein [Stylosanthes scabra]